MSTTDDLLKKLIAVTEEATAHMKNTSTFLQSLKAQVGEVITYMKDAESEVPEKMRRFIMYHHDIHDAVNQHAELGLEVPTHILREAERCDDRLRQLLEALHADGATFEKVRREMSKDPNNRWDHSRLLPKGKESA